MSISAVVIGKDVADQLDRCLRSLAFADEIIYVDVQSSDNSRQIASKYTKKVFLSAIESSFVEPQRNAALKYASSDWIILLDADEEIPSTLATKLQNLPENSDCIAYYLPRKNIFSGHWLSHTGWWPDYQLRFFQKGQVSWSDKIHSVPKINGKSKQLMAEEAWAIMHYNYKDTFSYLERFNHYTNIEAKQRLAEIEKQKIAWKITPATLFRSFSDDFFRRLFQFEGHQDGVRGLYLSILQATYQISTQMKIYDLMDNLPQLEENDAKALEKELKKFKKDLNYWLADLELENASGLKKIIARLKKKMAS